MITKEQNTFYKENGYLIVEDVLPENECDNYLSQIKTTRQIDPNVFIPIFTNKIIPKH